MAIVAAHLGIVDEEQINNMSFVFFEDVLAELSHKLTYDAIVNYAGNSFCKDSWDMIKNANPFAVGKDKGDSALKGVADLFSKGSVRVMNTNDTSAGHMYPKGKGVKESG